MAENMNLITGYQGVPHVTSADDGVINAAIFGKESYVLDIGEKFRAEIVTNNQIRVYDGAASIQGRVARIEASTYVDLTIDNGSQGMKRNDLVVVRYEKNADTLVESANLVVIKGSETAGTPTDPAYTEGSIFNGDLVAEFPLYRVPVDGLTVGTPVFLASRGAALSYLSEAKVQIVRLAPGASLTFSALAATAFVWNLASTWLKVGFRSDRVARTQEGTSGSQIATTVSGTTYTITNNSAAYLRGFIVIDASEG